MPTKEQIANLLMHPVDTVTGGLDQLSDKATAGAAQYKAAYDAALSESRWGDALGNRFAQGATETTAEAANWVSNELKGQDSAGSADVKVGKGVEGLYQTTAKINSHAGKEGAPKPEPGGEANVEEDPTEDEGLAAATRVMGAG